VERNQHRIYKWSQCYSCGKIYARHETTPEEKITGIIGTINNPFDDEKQIVGLGNKQNKTKNEKILEEIDQENDPDIRKALRQGNTVEIIEYRAGIRKIQNPYTSSGLLNEF